MDTFDVLIEKAQSKNSEAVLFHAAGNLAEAAATMREVTLLYSAAISLVELPGKVTVSLLKEHADACRLCGDYLAEAGEHTEAVNVFQEAVDLYSKIGDAEALELSKACAEKLLDNLESLRGSPERRLYLLINHYERRLHQLRLIAGTEREQAEASVHIARIFHRREKYKESYQYFVNALVLYSQIEQTHEVQVEVAECHHRVATLCSRYLDDVESAIEHYSAAIAIYESDTITPENTQPSLAQCRSGLEEISNEDISPVPLIEIEIGTPEIESQETSSDIFQIALFPLHTVLFPHFPMQLHIFEERYKFMISDCLERSKPFGIVLIKEGDEVGAPSKPHEIGCTAQILAVQKYDDGRMDILVAGQQRFRLLEYGEAEPPYLIGTVETIQDSGYDENQLIALANETSLLFQRYLTLLAESANLPLPDLKLPEDPAALAFCIAAIAQMPLDEKQELLAMTDARLRLVEEKKFLFAQIEELQARLIHQSIQNTSTEESMQVKINIAEAVEIDDPYYIKYMRDNRN